MRIFDDSAATAGVKMLSIGIATAGGSGIAGRAVQSTSENSHLIEAALSLTDLGVVAGIVLGVLGFLTQFVFLYRRDRREERALRIAERSDS